MAWLSGVQVLWQLGLSGYCSCHSDELTLVAVAASQFHSFVGKDGVRTAGIEIALVANEPLIYGHNPYDSFTHICADRSNTFCQQVECKHGYSPTSSTICPYLISSPSCCRTSVHSCYTQQCKLTCWINRGSGLNLHIHTSCSSNYWISRFWAGEAGKIWACRYRQKHLMRILRLLC